MSEAALILWLLSPVLDNTLRYTILGLLLALLVAYAVDHCTPSRMILRLEDTTKTLRETFDHAMANCPRDWAELRELGCKLTQIRRHLLDISSLATWKEYFRGLRGIFKTIRECNKEVKDLQTSVLRIMEAEHEHQLLMRVEEERGIFNALMGHVEDIGLVASRSEAIHMLRVTVLWQDHQENVAGSKVDEGEVEVKKEKT
ncbi:hypothetical protein B0H16DRAFT_1695510 [Mycena metata]|uniref:Uncharacterized protein n=1 Tax=Mycena metata TaxID=1033252 RepID=A0AAD7MX49_9AGAR|nr:hypothetical protein B0H16DRAFT_1695510 [Mycena metata]